MARLPGTGFRGEKTKFSTMIRTSSFEAISRVKENSGSLLRSPGEVIDYSAELFLDVDEKTAAIICNALLEARSKEERNAEECTDSFEKKELELSCDKIAQIERHFAMLANPSLLEENRSPVRRVELADGDYVLFPDDGSWVVINEGEAASSKHVGVVTVRNASGSGLPYFMFFLNCAVRHASDSFLDSILATISEAWPAVIELKEREIEAEYDSSGRILNQDEYLSSPRVGFFEILDANYLSNREDEPGKALVYRKGWNIAAK